MELILFVEVFLQDPSFPYTLHFHFAEILIEQYRSILKKTENVESEDLEASEKIVDILEDAIK